MLAPHAGPTTSRCYAPPYTLGPAPHVNTPRGGPHARAVAVPLVRTFPQHSYSASLPRSRAGVVSVRRPGPLQCLRFCRWPTPAGGHRAPSGPLWWPGPRPQNASGRCPDKTWQTVLAGCAAPLSFRPPFIRPPPRHKHTPTTRSPLFLNSNTAAPAQQRTRQRRVHSTNCPPQTLVYTKPSPSLSLSHAAVAEPTGSAPDETHVVAWPTPERQPIPVQHHHIPRSPSCPSLLPDYCFSPLTPRSPLTPA